MEYTSVIYIFFDYTILEIDCGTPLTTSNAVTDISKRTYNGTANVSCSTGYYFDSTPSQSYFILHCGQTKSWIVTVGQNTTCKGKYRVGHKNI